MVMEATKSLLFGSCTFISIVALVAVMIIDVLNRGSFWFYAPLAMLAGWFALVSFVFWADLRWNFLPGSGASGYVVRGGGANRREQVAEKLESLNTEEAPKRGQWKTHIFAVSTFAFIVLGLLTLTGAATHKSTDNIYWVYLPMAVMWFWCALVSAMFWADQVHDLFGRCFPSERRQAAEEHEMRVGALEYRGSV